MRFPKVTMRGETMLSEEDRLAYKNPPATDWYPGDTPPLKSRIGYYMVRNNPESLSKRAKFLRLNAPGRRWWNGKFWEAWKGGPSSIMGGKHHQWCGLTKEVK